MSGKSYTIIDLDGEQAFFFKSKREADRQWDLIVGLDRSWNLVFLEIGGSRRPGVVTLGMKMDGYVIGS